MSTQEIKSILHESIENIDDAEFLKTLQELLERKYSHEKYPNLTAEQLQRIDQSKEQIKNGESFSDKDADKLADEWLKK